MPDFREHSTDWTVWDSKVVLITYDLHVTAVMKWRKVYSTADTL